MNSAEEEIIITPDFLEQVESVVKGEILGRPGETYQQTLERFARNFYSHIQDAIQKNEYIYIGRISREEKPKQKKSKKAVENVNQPKLTFIPAENNPRINRQTEKLRPFSEHTKTTPAQLNLFDLIENEKEFSHTIELYDFMPKYVWGKVERVAGVFLPRLEREFECRGRKYKLTLYPASVEDDQGNEKYFYPAKREEVVEDALRKIMADGNGVFLNGEAAVTFTIYQLQKELKENGHSYSRDQIKESLKILARTDIEIKSESGNMEVLFSPIETLGFKGEDGEIQSFVRFSPLVTNSIKEKTFRLFNYEKVMSYRSVIARQLHKRMSHHYTQASFTDTYNILLTTIIRDFGLARRKQLKDNLRDVESAIEEMKEKNVVLSCKVEKILEKSARLKVADVKLTFLPHPEFINEVKRANARKKLETGSEVLPYFPTK
jgi:Initiator Replication protein